MKATTIIVAAVLSLQVITLIAGNNFSPLTPNSDANSSCCVVIMPTTPAEATFEDDVTLTDFVVLAPVTPGEADFSDSIEDQAVDFIVLTPVTPVEADFE